jgi:hypothetical protein
VIGLGTPNGHVSASLCNLTTRPRHACDLLAVSFVRVCAGVEVGGAWGWGAPQYQLAMLRADWLEAVANVAAVMRQVRAFSTPADSYGEGDPSIEHMESQLMGMYWGLGHSNSIVAIYYNTINIVVY